MNTAGDEWGYPSNKQSRKKGTSEGTNHRRKKSGPISGLVTRKFPKAAD